MNYKITNKYGPNCTVLLPGKCNARCEFCFWDSTEGKIKESTFVKRTVALLLALPEEFKTLSISGGEPTLSPVLYAFMHALAMVRHVRYFERVVFTTNGTKLEENRDVILLAVDHINISRHHYNDDQNNLIFGTDSVPSTSLLKRLIRMVHTQSFRRVDVTLNCVIPADTASAFCNRMVGYAQMVKADAISFRKEASTVDPTPAEQFYARHYETVSESQCPVCRGRTMDVEGYDVRWKGSVAEPSVDTNGIYELVIHPDGKLYADWSMKQPVDIVMLGAVLAEDRMFSARLRSMKQMFIDTDFANKLHVPKAGCTGGCGGDSSGCGHGTGC